MIKVKALGSLIIILGFSYFKLDKRSITLPDLLKIIFKMSANKIDHSKILSNVLICINGIVLSKDINKIIIKAGDEITLLPISHGG